VASQRLATTPHLMSLEHGPQRSLVLLGVLNALPGRQKIWRCALLRAQPWPGRAVFVVGEPLRRDLLYIPHMPSDILRVPIAESNKNGAVVFGTVTAFVKFGAFLQYAYHQPEPLIARADDDSFVSLPMLVTYATVLGQQAFPSARIYAGTFEWFNWIPSKLKSTGWGNGPRQATAAGRRLHKCVQDGQSASYCLGPYMFAKGPLVLLSRDLTRAVARSDAFTTAMAKARSSDVARAGQRVDDDVQLGVWIAALANVSYVSLHSRVWRERYAHQSWAGARIEPSVVLALHKWPWPCWLRTIDTVQGLAAHVVGAAESMAESRSAQPTPQPPLIQCTPKSCAYEGTCAHTREAQFTCRFVRLPALQVPDATPPSKMGTVGWVGMQRSPPAWIELRSASGSRAPQPPYVSCNDRWNSTFARERLVPMADVMNGGGGRGRGAWGNEEAGVTAQAWPTPDCRAMWDAIS